MDSQCAVSDFGCFAQRLWGLATAAKSATFAPSTGKATSPSAFGLADSCSASQRSPLLRKPPPKGHPVYDELHDQGISVSRKRIARLMPEEGLVGRSHTRRRVQTTDSRHAHAVANNLLERRFAPQEVAHPNRFWCGDITYLPTLEGWAYLATVKDLFSRRGCPLGGWDGLWMIIWKPPWSPRHGNGHSKRAVLRRIKGQNFIIATGVANTAALCFKNS